MSENTTDSKGVSQPGRFIPTHSTRARAALTSIEASLKAAQSSIIARRFWEQVEELEGLAHRFENDLADPAYGPTWDMS